LPAAHDPGQQIVGGVAPLQGLRLAALAQYPLRRGEGLLLYQGLVKALVAVVLERHLAGIDGVAQHVDDRARRERNTRLGRETFGVEQLFDRLRAELIFDVEIKDAPHDAGLRVVGQEQLRFLVAQVPVGDL
jgi:hypothetical protein